MILYGIKNCDSVKKARAWLDGRALNYRFHDFRQEGIDLTLLQRWQDSLGYEAFLNRKSTSWRNLSESDKQDLNAEKALELMLNHPTLIKRPILETGSKTLIGFSPDYYQTEL